MGKASTARKVIDLMDDVDLEDFAPTISREHGAVTDAAKHFLKNPKRSLFPGIYKEPSQLVDEANARYEPEGPELRELFGVSRSDLADMADRRGDAEVDLKYGSKQGLNVKATDSVMTRQNADRLLSALSEAQDGSPGLWRGMKGWYQMDPAAELLQSWYGKEEGLRLYNRFNDMTAMASPGSEVATELQRGSAANMMLNKGRFEEFERLGGVPMEKRKKNFPEEMRTIKSHPYHSTAHAGPMKKFVHGGGEDIDMKSAKVPLYAAAGRKQGHGKQTSQPVADAHFSRAIGFSDVVGDKTNPGRSMVRTEYRKIPQWFRENVSGELGIEAVPAQAILWGLMSPQTGVTSSIGAPKLELLARGVIEASKRTGRDPKEMLRRILSGDDHAYAGGGSVARNLIDGTFYSALAEALPQLQKKLTGNQAKAQLTKLGVKPDELAETGMLEHLDSIGDDGTTVDELIGAYGPYGVNKPVKVRTDELSNRSVERAREELRNDDRFISARSDIEDDEFDRYFDPRPYRGTIDIDDETGLWKVYDDTGDNVVEDGFADEAAAQSRLDEMAAAHRDAQEEDFRSGIEIDDDAVEGRLGISGTSDSPEYFEPSYDYNYKTKGGTNYREMVIKLSGGERFDDGANHTNHWEDKGHEQVLASLRLQDHRAPGSKKVLLADETQSDWGQAWRESGGGSDPEKVRALAEAVGAARDNLEAIKPEYNEIRRAHADGEAGNDMMNEVEERYSVARQEFARLNSELELERGKNGDLPDRAPFIDNTSKWVDLAIKKTLSEAAKSDADIVAWPKGEDVADRYNMREVIGEVAHKPVGDGRHYISAKDVQGRNIHSGQYSAEELDNVVGKSLADKIRAGEGDDIMSDEEMHRLSAAVVSAKADMEAARKLLNEALEAKNKEEVSKAYADHNSAATRLSRLEILLSNAPSKFGIKKLSGDGIPVGGEGHIQFYNNIYPKRMQEVLRKAGFGKVPIEDVQLVQKQFTKSDPNFSKSAAQLEALKSEGYSPLEATFEQARAVLDEVRSSDPDAFKEITNVLRSVKEEVVTEYEGPMAHGIKLTPEMKQKIIQLGFPLFLVAAALGIGEDELAAQLSDGGQQEFAAGGYVEEMPNDRHVVDDMSMASTPENLQHEISEDELSSVTVVQLDDGSFAIVDAEGNVLEEGFETPEEAEHVLSIAKETPQVADEEHPEIEGYSKGGLVKALSRKIGELILPSEGLHVPPKGKPGTFKLPGLEDSFDATPIQEIEDVARKYSLERGLDNEISAYPEFDDERAARIAAEYDKARHDPSNPEVKAHYDEMLGETLDQYNALKDLGLDFHFLRDGEADPYAASPALGYKDLVENGRLTVFPTDNGFGSSDLDVSGNPLLKRVGKIGDLDNATANDAFRVVHDVFGHFGPGNPFFRHKGEDRAWMHHSKMFGPRARRAMTSETRGQNSWLNFGPYAEKNRTALGGDTHFADQKTTLLPEWVSEMDDVPEFSIGGLVSRIARGNKMFSKARQNAHRMTRDELFDETGFYQGLEGNEDRFLRHEIDDSEAQLKDWPTLSKAEMKVGDMLDHPELFDHYPRLGEVPVNLNRERGGAMHRDMSRMELPTLKELEHEDWVRHFPDGMIKEDRPKSMVLHELQHGIQSIEDFEPGSGPINASDTITRVLKGHDDKKKYRDLLSDIYRKGLDSDKNYKAYRRHGGEVESRAVETRMNLGKKLRRSSMPLDDYDVRIEDILLPKHKDKSYNLQPALKILR